MRPQLVAAALLACACACAAAGCGQGARPVLRVSAAASLRDAFGRYAGQVTFADVHYSFAGSDALAAQIVLGARPDVFASANTKLPSELFARHLVQAPVEFAANVLVLAVPARSRITSLGGAMRPGVTIAVGTATVPVGAYTAAALSRLPATRRRLLEGNVRDREPDVTGIVGKLLTGAVDAGFVYRTDVTATRGALRAVALPRALQPRVAYAAAVVRASAHPAAARAFIDGLLGGRGQSDLRRDGFLAPAR